MSKYSFAEKYQFNKARAKGCNFASGYCLGADLYADYPRQNTEFQAAVRTYIDTARDSAVSLNSGFEKGVMCGYRDAANERKAREKARTQERKRARESGKYCPY